MEKRVCKYDDTINYGNIFSHFKVDSKQPSQLRLVRHVFEIQIASVFTYRVCILNAKSMP